MLLFDDKKFIGAKIKQLRVQAKLSQAELSEKIAMTEKNLSNIERGIQLPALNSFLRLLNVLNVSLNEFGMDFEIVENTERYELIKEIYLANSQEIKAFKSILDTIKTLK